LLRGGNILEGMGGPAHIVGFEMRGEKGYKESVPRQKPSIQRRGSIGEPGDGPD